MKLLSRLIIIISIIGSLYYSTALIQSGNIYGVLVKLTIVFTMLVPNIIEKVFKTKFPDSLKFIYVVFIFMAHFLGSIVDLYHKIYWYDTFIHFLSGILVAVIANFLIVKTKIYNNRNIIMWFLFMVACSSLIAVSWEIFEFVSDKAFNADAQNVLTTGVDDTMVDMIVALLGAMLYGITFIYEKVNNMNGIINKYMNSIFK